MTAIALTPVAQLAPTRARFALWIVVIAGGPALNLVMQVTGYLATPTASRPEIAWTTLHSAVPVVFAVSAFVALQVGESRLPIVIIIAMSYLWVPQTFFSVLAHLGYVWPLVRSIELVWAFLLGLLALAYPRGRYVGRVDRTIAVSGLVISVVRLVMVLLTDQPVQPGCDCAPNAYAITSDPTIFDISDLAYRIVGAVVVLFISGRLFVQWTRASVPARTVAFVMPIGLIAWTLALIVEAVSFAASRRGTATLVVATVNSGPIAIVSLFAVASIPICYVAGSVHLRNTRGRVADLMRITREGVDRAVWRESLAETLQDPGVEVYWWDDAGGAYHDSDGVPIDLPVDSDTATLTLLPIAAGDGSPIAVIRHDRALAENERLLDGVSTALRLSVDNGQLRTQVGRTLEQVRESRARIVEAGDEARKRLERDLHDGSQQQLVALAMQLRSLSDGQRAAGHPDLADDLEVVLGRLTQALRELRELARGIHPTALVEGGLSLALPELASRCPIPVVVEGEFDSRMPELVEATAYFVVSECLANISRHSQARQAWLRVDADRDRLRVVVRDNGIGGASADAGSGILGLADRVEAMGGWLDLRSPRGEGTTVIVEMPLALPVDA